jgi:hypothetical protein
VRLEGIVHLFAWKNGLLLTNLLFHSKQKGQEFRMFHRMPLALLAAPEL